MLGFPATDIPGARSPCIPWRRAPPGRRSTPCLRLPSPGNTSGDRPRNGLRAPPHGCCQHFRPAFQWKPSSLSLSRIGLTGTALNSNQTHLPTTWACSNNSGISRPSHSSKSRVGNELASDAFTVTLLLPSTGLHRLLLVWLLSLEARTARRFGREGRWIGKNCVPFSILGRQNLCRNERGLERMQSCCGCRSQALHQPSVSK